MISFLDKLMIEIRCIVASMFIFLIWMVRLLFSIEYIWNHSISRKFYEDSFISFSLFHIEVFMSMKVIDNNNTKFNIYTWILQTMFLHYSFHMYLFYFVICFVICNTYSVSSKLGLYDERTNESIYIFRSQTSRIKL